MEATRWAKHQRTHHRGEAQQFWVAHGGTRAVGAEDPCRYTVTPAARPWLKYLVICACSARCAALPGGTVRPRRSLTTHAGAAGGAQPPPGAAAGGGGGEAAAAAAADAPGALPGGGPRPRQARRGRPGGAAAGAAVVPETMAVPFPEPPAAAAVGAPDGAAAGGAEAPPPWALEWDLSGGTAARRALDALSPEYILEHHLFTGTALKANYVPHFAGALAGVLAGLQAAVTAAAAPPPPGLAPVGGAAADPAAARATAGAWAKMLHLLPALLASSDGSVKRGDRFTAFLAGDLGGLSAQALRYARHQAAKPRPADTAESIRRKAVRAARRKSKGGLRRAARMLAEGAATFAGDSQAKLDVMHRKHPVGDPPAELEAASLEAAAMAAARMGELEIELPVFTAEAIRAAVADADAASTAGPSALSFAMLQQCLHESLGGVAERLAELLAWLATTAYATPDALPDEFWYLHTTARLFAVGEKARPIACGEALRRLFGRLFCQEPANKARTAALLETAGQFGVGARGGSERVALMAQLVYDGGGVVLTIDGTNAFNALKRTALLRAVAEFMPHLYPYASKVYGPHSTPVLQFAMDGSELAEPVLSRQGVQQGDPLGPLLFALTVLPVMTSFRDKFPDMGLPAYLDDMTILFMPPQLTPRALVRLEAAFQHVADGLGAVGVAVNTTKSVCLLPAASGPRSGNASATTAAAAQAALSVPVAYDGVALLASERCQSGGIALMGVPIGCAEYVACAAQRKLRAPGTDRLLSELARMDDAQVAFTLLRLCVPSLATYLARNLPLALLGDELRRLDAAVLCALAAVLQEPPAHDVFVPEGARPLVPGSDGPSDWDVALAEVRHPAWDGIMPVSLSPAQQAQVRLRQRHGGLGLPSAAHRAPAAFLGRTVEALGPALSALPAAIRARLRLHHGRLLLAGSTMVHSHAALESMRQCGDATASALPKLLPPAWCGPWQPAAAAAAGNGSEGVAAAGRGLVDLLLPPESAAATAGGAGVRTRRLAAQPGPAGAGRRRRRFGVPPHRQAALARHLDAHAAQQFQRALCDEAGAPGSMPRARALARYRSQVAPGAMAWAGALPMFEHMGMTGPIFRETGRRHLGIERPACGGLCPQDKCQRALDGVHARRCAITGETSRRHDKLVQAMVAQLRATIPVAGLQTEQRHPFALGADPRRRMDIIIAGGTLRLPPTAHEPQGGGARDACIDVTIVDGTQDALCVRASQDINTALEKASLAKHNRYGPLLDSRRSTLYPAAFDQFGAACAEVHSLLRVFAAHPGRGAAPAEPAQRGAFARRFSRFRQSLSVCLQRSISQSVFVAWGKARPTSPGTVPDRAAYARLRLLVPRSPPALGEVAAAPSATGVG